MAKRKKKPTYVYWDKSNERWRVQIHLDNANIYGGYYDTQAEALEAAKKLRKQHDHHYKPVGRFLHTSGIKKIVEAFEATTDLEIKATVTWLKRMVQKRKRYGSSKNKQEDGK